MQEEKDLTTLSGLADYLFDDDEEQQVVEETPTVETTEPEPTPQEEESTDPQPETETTPQEEETTEPEPTEEPVASEETPESDEEDIQIPYSDISSALAELYGVELNEEDLTENSLQSLADHIEAIAQVKAQEISEYASPEVKEINEIIKQGGTLEDYVKAKFEKPFDVKTISLESETDLARAATVYYNSTTKMSPERIAKQVKLLQDSGELKDFVESEAIPGIEEVSKEKAENYKKQVERDAIQKQQENKNRVEAAKSKILSKSSFAGVDVNEDTKQQFIKFLYGDENGTEPESVKVLREKPEIELDMLFVLFQNQKNPKALAQTLESKLTKKLRENYKSQNEKRVKAISQKGKLSGKQQGAKNNNKENDFLDDILNSLPSV